jgi:hypothetical protein
MVLTGDCTTDGTIFIPDGYTLDGQGFTITAVDPAAGHFRGAVIQNAGPIAHVRNLTVTAIGIEDVCDVGADYLSGIRFSGASGSIKDSTVVDINQGLSGCQEGLAIDIFNPPFDGTHPNTKTVVVSNNVVTNYQKNGITADGDVYATITGNIVTGAGPVGHIAQNGIQVGFGGMGSVVGNTIIGNFYTEPGWVAVGLLLFYVQANLVKHSNNIFRNNQRNLALLTSQSLSPGP